MEIKKHKTWKKGVVKSFAEARKVFLYKGERKVLEFLSFVDFAMLEDIARATILSQSVLKKKYLRELEAIGFIKRTTLDKITLYSLQKWGMYKISEGIIKSKRDLTKRELKKIAKEKGIFSQAEAFAMPEHQILNARVGTELFRAHLLAEKQAQEENILKLLNKREAEHFIRHFFELEGKMPSGVPIPDFILKGRSEVIFVEVETGDNKKSRLRDKFRRYKFLAEEFKRQYAVYILFVVDSREDKVRWVRKAVKAQQPSRPYVFSLDVNFKRKLVDVAELREWLENWHELEEQGLWREGFIGSSGDIFNLKSLEENRIMSQREINIEKKRLEEYEEELQRRELEKEKERQEEEERRKAREREEEERKKEEEERKKAEFEKKKKEFLEKYTKFDYDRDYNGKVKSGAKELGIRRSDLRDPDFKVAVDYNRVFVILKFEDFINLKTKLQFELECPQKVGKGEECEVIGFENQNGNNPFIPIPLIREFNKPLQKVIKEGVREAILNAQKINPEDTNYGMYSIYYYLSK
jgi:hypothetical protein